MPASIIDIGKGRFNVIRSNCSKDMAGRMAKHALSPQITYKHGRKKTRKTSPKTSRFNQDLPPPPEPPSPGGLRFLSDAEFIMKET
jgi:hypothetical protein